MASDPESPAVQRAVFTTTHWSVVLAARNSSPDARDALNALCSAYWYPLYAFVRHQGYAPHDAQDLTQEFFARLLENSWLHSVDPARGRFRSWLLTALKRFLTNEWRKTQTLKRGHGIPFVSMDSAEDRYALEPADPVTAEHLFERRWALTLLDRVLEQLGTEMAQSGRTAQFNALKPLLTGHHSLSYTDLAAQLGKSEGALKVAVHRMRDRYRDLIREEVARTVDSPAEVDAEIHALFEALS